MTDAPGRSDEHRKDEDQRRAAARTEAARELRELYPDDWNRLLEAAMQERGIKWKPRATSEQKALSEIKRLLAEHPDLTTEDVFG